MRETKKNIYMQKMVLKCMEDEKKEKRQKNGGETKLQKRGLLGKINQRSEGNINGGKMEEKKQESRK